MQRAIAGQTQPHPAYGGQNKVSSLFGPFWLWRWSREATCGAAPIHRRSAIHSNVIVVSRRWRAARRTSCGSLLRRPWRSGAAQPRASNSSWAIRWAFALADGRTSSPPSRGVDLSLTCVRDSELPSHHPKPKPSRLAGNVKPPHPSVVEKLRSDPDWDLLLASSSRQESY
jgi:hypothetical protein